MVADQLRALGIAPGDVLLAHISFRAVRPLAGGPTGLIGAIRDAIGPGGTLVMPSWTGSDDDPFDPATTPAAAALGFVAETFRRLPEVQRSDHPFAFAAVGPAAKDVVSGPMPLPPHMPDSPVGRVHDLDGQVLLLGVGHDANTTLHLAELLARVPYRVPKYCTILNHGRRERIDYLENDHCGTCFALVDGWLREQGLQTEGRAGNAHARLARSRDIVDVACAQLARDPRVFLHPPSAGCAECDAARHGVSP